MEAHPGSPAARRNLAATEGRDLHGVGRTAPAENAKQDRRTLWPKGCAQKGLGRPHQRLDALFSSHSTNAAPNHSTIGRFLDPFNVLESGLGNGAPLDE